MKTDFFSKAQLYDKFRWEYSTSAVDFIKKYANIGKETSILDIGAGTGKLSKHFAGSTGRVYAVEPDSNMFAILEKNIAGVRALQRFSDNMPEIPDSSVNVIIAAHALHWLKFQKTLKEFNRIAAEGCLIFSVTNHDISDSPLYHATGELIKKYSRAEVNSGKDLINIDNYFLDNDIMEKTFEFADRIDFETYLGSLVSASFLPGPDDSDFSGFRKHAENTFREHAGNGPADIRISTKVRFGYLASADSIPSKPHTGQGRE